MNHAARALRLYIVAAEESGDALGGALARALREGAGGTLSLAGVGSHAMAAAGIISPFPINELSIIGFNMIPRRLPTILRRIRQTADAVIAAKPDALVIIDGPDFTHRVARRVRRRAPSIPILDYVSPSVWAWRPWRARAMRGYVDCVLAILPFEPAEHRRLAGPPCVYVGHPLTERLSDLRPGAGDLQRGPSEPPLVLVLPGSRSSEIHRLLGIFGAAIARVGARAGPLELVLPTLPHLLNDVSAATAAWSLRPRVVVEAADKWAAFRSARAALAASGTVTLELALAGVPTVAAYRVSRLEEIILRGLIALRGAGNPGMVNSVILANLVIGAKVVPEFLQDDCTPDNLAAALIPLLSETVQRRRQVEAFARLDQMMATGAAAPSERAAAIVLDIARRGRTRALGDGIRQPC
jgi:lipid-A-disaccharide synthase